MASAGPALDGTTPRTPGNRSREAGREGSGLRCLKGAGWETCVLLYSPSAPTKPQTPWTEANVPPFRLPAHEDENSDLTKAVVARPQGKVRARNYLEVLLCLDKGDLETRRGEAAPPQVRSEWLYSPLLSAIWPLATCCLWLRTADSPTRHCLVQRLTLSSLQSPGWSQSLPRVHAASSGTAPHSCSSPVTPSLTESIKILCVYRIDRYI